MGKRNIEKKVIRSDNIESITYNRDTFILEITYMNQKTFQYYGVAEYVFDELIHAKSISKFINNYIRNMGYMFDRL